MTLFFNTLFSPNKQNVVGALLYVFLFIFIFVEHHYYRKKKKNASDVSTESSLSTLSHTENYLDRHYYITVWNKKI